MSSYLDYASLVATHAAAHSLSPLVVAAVIQTESGWRNVKNAAGPDARPGPRAACASAHPGLQHRHHHRTDAAYGTVGSPDHCT